MRNILTQTVLATLTFFVVTLSSGCLKDKLTRTYTLLKPVYQDKSAVLASIKSSAPRPLSAPGKMYMLGKYIYLNEINKGVHIIDNGNAQKPKAIGFIPIPGNLDIAVNGTTLYADLFTDMLAIDIADPANARVVKTIPNVFPERQYQNGFLADTSKYITDWIRVDTTVDDRAQLPWMECRRCFMLASDAGNKSGTYVPGVAGSMSRFVIVEDRLYTVNISDLGVYDISTSTDPHFVTKTPVGWNIETIYPFKQNLFIGSSNGMFIYSMSNPNQPTRLGSFSHARACDPVVADDNYAYVTLRAGTFCMGTANQLDVINVQDVLSPRLVKTYPLNNPHGLAKDKDLLFVCDGSDGLKVYDARNVADLKLIKHIRGFDAYDVVAWDNVLVLVAKNGLYQFDYSNPQDIRLLSTYAINR